MANPLANPPMLSLLLNPKSISEQIATLKALKNDIVGHQQRKEIWVGLGVLDPVVRLATARAVQGRQDGEERDNRNWSLRKLEEDEMVRLQALYIIGSVAHGGPPFLAPLHLTSALPAILSNFSPSKNAPQLVLAALRALSNLIESALLASSSQPLNTGLIADSLFSPPHVNSLSQILLQSSTTRSVQSQIAMAVSLIGRLCREERHQVTLANVGILDVLASRLAGFVVLHGLVLPGADIIAQKEGTWDHFPYNIPENADLARTLEAIAAIVGESRLRASQLVYSRGILAVFPISSPFEVRGDRSIETAWNSFASSDLSSRQSTLNAVDFLVPYVPLNQPMASSTLVTAFPPLGISRSFEQLVQLGRPKGYTYTEPSQRTGSNQLNVTFADPNEPESPLIAYLFWLTRSSKWLERLMASSLLTVLYRAGLTKKSRETALGMLVVPLLVELLDHCSVPEPSTPSSRKSADAECYIIKERAPAVLATLIVDSEFLQKAAYDAGAVGKIAKIFKAAFDPVVEKSDVRSWSPNALEKQDREAAYLSSSSQLGPDGYSANLANNIRVRESALRAITALVPFKDEYRKAFIDLDIVSRVVEALSLNPENPSVRNSSKEEGDITSGMGSNPVSVLIAACGTVRYLSRSVSILRTTLIDNGIVMPVFRLLRHQDIDVQIAATAAVCNLVMDFSPMRAIISEAGVLKLLCEHAHSGNVKLRLNALWALKHLVLSAGNDVKKTCLEELGQGWLIQLICDDSEDEIVSPGESLSRPFVNNGDEQMQTDQYENDESKMTDSIGALGQASIGPMAAQRSADVRGSAQLVAARLANLRALESNVARRARRDDVAVQEQGLDFIRNLIGGYDNVGLAETSEMIDFLFSALGQDQIFHILASKLRTRIFSAFGKGGPLGNDEPNVIAPQPEIIISVTYILVHIAASVPRHRQLIIAQTELLKLLLPHFSNPRKEVRVALCWLVTNLTVEENIDDGHACAQRVQELTNLGFLLKLEGLKQDSELDVRERVKNAVYQMSVLKKL